MNGNQYSKDNPKPTAADDRRAYKFQDYESDDEYYAPVTFQQNQAFGDKYNAYDAQTNKDHKHLDQLALGFKIYAGVNALFSSIPVIHLVIGILWVTGKMDSGNNAPPELFGWIFIIFALFFILSGYALSVCSLYAGKALKERRNYTFCFVMSCINCAFMPVGTILGIFGIIVLTRDSVKSLFNDKAPTMRFD